MTDKMIRVVVEGGEQLTVPMTQQEWNDVQLDLQNPDTDQVFLSDVGFVSKSKLIAAYDVSELERRVQQDARRRQSEVQKEQKEFRARQEAELRQREQSNNRDPRANRDNPGRGF